MPQRTGARFVCQPVVCQPAAIRSDSVYRTTLRCAV